MPEFSCPEGKGGETCFQILIYCILKIQFFSVFISYRVASELPLARLLFDELNHTVTPGGHRVTVYWDAHRLVKVILCLV